MRIVATFSAGPPYPQVFQVGADTDVWSQNGVFQLSPAGLEPLARGEVFRDRRVDGLLPVADGLLVLIREEGLFLFREGAAVPFAAEASRWAAEHRIHTGCRLPDGRWALGSVLGGVLLLRFDGVVDQVIDSGVGLFDDLVYGMAIDCEGALWLALNRDLARVEVASPLSVIDRRSGLAGSVYAIARHRDALWVGTAAGLFTSAPGAATAPPEPGTAPPWGQMPRMRPIAGLPLSAWSLLPVGEDLLIGTATGVSQLSGGGAPREVAGVEPRTAYALAPSPSDPQRVWVGMEDGVVALRRQGASWRAAGRVAEISSPVRTIVEGDGVLWLGTDLDGVVGLALPPAGAGFGADAAPPRRIAPGESINLFRIAGRILAAREKQILRLDEAKGELVEDPELAGVEPPGRVLNLAEDAQGNLWMNTNPPSVALRQEGG